MPQEDDDFDQAMRSLRTMLGLACCLTSGSLIVLAYGSWQLLVALVLLYWPLSMALDFDLRRGWRIRTRSALSGMKMLFGVDVLVAGFVVVGPTLVAQRLGLEIGPAALALVLSAALSALWLEATSQGVSVIGAIVLFEYLIVPPTRSFAFTSAQDAFAFALATCAVIVMAWGTRQQATLSAHHA